MPAATCTWRAARSAPTSRPRRARCSPRRRATSMASWPALRPMAAAYSGLPTWAPAPTTRRISCSWGPMAGCTCWARRWAPGP
uniref:Uncharacterized protein n=1 Tax=Tanacetum cinerariifolium TaxID=118510 RepID=A0A699XSA0_TANCI|nr:hypothetical protein [Tanacetum cinerariifolium]